MDGSDHQSVIVYCAADDRKFKMVMRGDLHKLTVEKIKRYLEKSTHVAVENQILTTGNGRLLANDMCGGDFGLCANATLQLSFVNSTVNHTASAHDAGASSPAATLRQDVQGRERQRAMADTSAVATPPPGQLGYSQMGSIGGASPAASSYPAHPRRGDEDDGREVRMSRMTTPRNVVPADTYNTPPAGAATTPRGHPTPVGAAPHPVEANPLHSKVLALEDENRALRREVEQLRRQEAQAALLQPPQQLTVVANAKANLAELSKELGVHLAFDDTLSCVVGADDHNTIVLTVDPPTERLYMYSTLVTALPDDPVLRLRLFESILEWAMLGRDMAGGGAGICSRSGIVMMSTTIDLRHCNTMALRDMAPVFVESLARWRNAAASIAPPTRAAAAAVAHEQSPQHRSYF
jgi:hypothetical protein